MNAPNYRAIEKEIDELVIDTEYGMKQVLNPLFERAVSEQEDTLSETLGLRLGNRSVTKNICKGGQFVEKKDRILATPYQKGPAGV